METNVERAYQTPASGTARRILLYWGEPTTKEFFRYWRTKSSSGAGVCIWNGNPGMNTPGNPRTSTPFSPVSLMIMQTLSTPPSRSSHTDLACTAAMRAVWGAMLMSLFWCHVECKWGSSRKSTCAMGLLKAKPGDPYIRSFENQNID